MPRNVGTKTIEDFGDQWTRYSDNGGYYGSIDMLRDILEPLVPLESVAGLRVAEIGSGSGRIVNMLLDAGAAHVTAVEPSSAVEVLADNIASRADRVTILAVAGDALPPKPAQDLIVSIGVIHHIPEPEPVVEAAMAALRPGGRLLIWLYGHEGNAAYLALAKPLRVFTTRLPHRALAGLCHALNTALGLYARLCEILPLPLRSYMREVVCKLSRDKRYLVIYDQLKPAYAKYYRRAEATALLERAGFCAIALHHRHGYSWTVIGTKPVA